MPRVPFNSPFTTGREFDYIRRAIENMHVSGDGMFTRKCQALLEQTLGAPRVLLTTSCTDALEMSALLLDLEPGDEVIVPSFTFVSTANAFALRGAKIVFADVRPDTLCLDESQLAALITPRTRAVVPVHYGGIACEMETISQLARDRGLAVIEDNAHGLFGAYRNRPLGTWGQLATLSFHETKNISCGEGGALVINDPGLIERAEIIREKGTNRSRFFRGEVDKYTWVDLGSSHLPSDMLAAYLFAQLEEREAIQAARRRIWECYDRELRDWAADHDVRLPVVPAGCSPSWHLYSLVLPTPDLRDRVIAWLQSRGIASVFHYQPLHLSEMGRRFGGSRGDCPVTEAVSARLLRLPFFNGLIEADQLSVLQTLRDFRF
ncbi:MAG TPA: dTDP-4-amino-4,6-dideoxygalactose transaminase [Planctomycetaceae bacterium]|nr:dTDP-4-amino-4,6-dideoxygalactose transaminase [Planctomycetaceae bacterium]